MPTPSVSGKRQQPDSSPSPVHAGNKQQKTSPCISIWDTERPPPPPLTPLKAVSQGPTAAAHTPGRDVTLLNMDSTTYVTRSPLCARKALQSRFDGDPSAQNHMSTVPQPLSSVDPITSTMASVVGPPNPVPVVNAPAPVGSSTHPASIVPQPAHSTLSAHTVLEAAMSTSTSPVSSIHEPRWLDKIMCRFNSLQLLGMADDTDYPERQEAE